MESEQNIGNENLMNNHKITINAQNHLQISGITNVESANESGLVLYIGKTMLTIDGEKMKVQKIDVDSGNVEVIGLVKSLKYSEAKSKGGLLKKLRN